MQVLDHVGPGGERSLALTLLRPNSLLTGKVTENSRFSVLEFDLRSSPNCTFCWRKTKLTSCPPQIGTGNPSVSRTDPPLSEENHRRWKGLLPETLKRLASSVC